MQEAASAARADGKTIALVPTMGALHEGHLSLIRKARDIADWVITSVFVNPTQFGPGEDFERYPREPSKDAALAFGAGSDVVFMPEASAMYPAGFQTSVVPEGVAAALEGTIRPGHFEGVATVVAKLFNITKPHVAVFGQKDAQQAFIIRRMVADLNMNVRISVEPTVREADGLAMSSRNRYLSADERSRSTCLIKALFAARARILAGERSARDIGRAAMEELKKASPTAIDYVAVLDAHTFTVLDPVGPGPVLVALAVRFGPTRLIDNMIVDLQAHHSQEQ
jgi:pantoate--beta-alanine ligase